MKIACSLRGSVILAPEWDVNALFLLHIKQSFVLLHQW